MRTIFVAAMLILSVLPATADDFGRAQGGAFWLKDQPWPNTRRDAATTSSTATRLRYTKNYTDELAARLGVVNGRAEFFHQRLTGSSDAASPALVGSFGRGGAMVAFRWHPGD